jgi:HEAT repeat protein
VHLARAGCLNGDPILISHASAYRSEEDESKLRAEIELIKNDTLREKVRDAFSGRICVKDEDLLAALLAMLGSSSEAVRAETLLVVRHFEKRSVSAEVRKALRDPSARARLMALFAVVDMCDEGAADLVKRLRRHDPDGDVRRYAKKVSKIFKQGCTTPFQDTTERE